MARTLTPDKPRALIAAVAAGLIAIAPCSAMQLAVVARGGGQHLGLCYAKPSARAKANPFRCATAVAWDLC